MTASSAAEPSGRPPAGQPGSYASPYPDPGYGAPEDATARAGASPWPPAASPGGQDWAERDWGGGQDWSTSAVWPPAPTGDDGGDGPIAGHQVGLAQPPGRPGSP